LGLSWPRPSPTHCTSPL